MTEDWRNALDNNQAVGIVAIDLSKAFDCMSHGLLITKLSAYGFSMDACKMIKSYLVARLQRVKIGDTFSEWVTNVKGVPQGSILGPLLFNIFINDLLFINLSSKIYNYADDNTLSYVSSDLNEVKIKLEQDCLNVMEWFQANHMKANSEKFQVMFLNKNDITSNHTLVINNECTRSLSSINVLGIGIDKNLNFSIHLDDVCNQTSKQINALKRIKHYLDKKCKNTIYNSYISSNFNYCPLVWMFTGKLNLDKLENVNKRALRFIENQNDMPYEELCKEAKKFTVNRRCIKSAAIQMYKIKNKMAPLYLQEIFSVREDIYNLRANDTFSIPQFNSIKYGKKSLRYYGAKLWAHIPSNIRSKVSLSSFKSAVTDWLHNQNDIMNINFLPTTISHKM